MTTLPMASFEAAARAAIDECDGDLEATVRQLLLELLIAREIATVYKGASSGGFLRGREPHVTVELV